MKIKAIYNFSEDINFKLLKDCGKKIKDGFTIVFPTETVYGIGTNALDKKAVKKIFIAKGRPTDNPLIVHISDYRMLKPLVKNVTKIEKKLMKTFWPGPMTIVLPKTDLIPDIVTCGMDTVGIRMPSNIIAKKLIKYAKVPVAAPSANISGRPSGTALEDIVDELDDKVDYMIDGGACEVGVESTVIKVVNDEVIILRPGKITKEDIEDLGISVKLDSHIFSDVKNDEKVLSPGMKHRHYAPKTKAILVENAKKENFVDYVDKLILENKRVCVISFDEYKKEFELKQNVEFLNLGSYSNLAQISKKLFSVLRKIDKLNVDICIISAVEKKGIGTAIMNRLYRACGYNIVKL
ncbi:MAG: L-threonylcarbamoyladenylate synthase [Clostridia bacterium]